MFDSEQVKNDFPILWRKVHAKPLVYLDNAATSQKPKQVIEAISNYYQNHNANVHRGVHQLSDESTQILEQSREKISAFFGVKTEELIFTRNSTEAINGVAYGWADHHLQDGDIILLSGMEHHSNLVVWQQVAKRTGAALEYIELAEDTALDLESMQKLLKKHGENIKLIALPHVSNALGTVNPIKEISKLVSINFKAGDRPRILIDGAQSVPHMPVDFAKLGVDFFAFSGHKMLGPMGVGGLLVRDELLRSGEIQPWLFGGGMIEAVYRQNSEFHSDAIERFTAGTPDVASVVGLAAAVDYLSDLGMKNVMSHDLKMVQYTLSELKNVGSLQIVGPDHAGTESQPARIGSVSFLIDGVHAHDVSQVLDSEGIAVRSGHHCTMPLHQDNDWIATVRASFHVYTSQEDIDALVSGLSKVARIFQL